MGFGPVGQSAVCSRGVSASETDYGVKAFPLGGYVRIAGMNPYEEIRPEDHAADLRAKPTASARW